MHGKISKIEKRVSVKIKAMNKQSSKSSKPATINDVARLAGTSVTTVSRVLSNSGYPVNSATAERVRDASRKLNYTPNLAGHLLKAHSAKILGLVIPTFQNPFFIQVVAGIEDAAASKGYTALIFNSHRSIITERELIRNISMMNIHGLLLSSLDTDSSSLESFLGSGGCAAVLEACYEMPKHVRLVDATLDMSENAALAVRALLELGHRKIALLTTPIVKLNRRRVYQGYRIAMDEYNIPVDDRLVIESSSETEQDRIVYEFDAGRELGLRFLSEGQGCTAILAVNDLVACGIVHCLLEHNVRIPEDVSVIGIDNIQQDIMMTPTISTVDQDSYRHGYESCLMLIDTLEHPENQQRRGINIPPKLILRDSVKSHDR